MILANPETVPGQRARASHGGRGEYFVRTLLDTPAGAAAFKYIRDLSLQPGSSIGPHPHTDDEEVYFVISGQGVMNVDGEEQAVGPGSVVLTLAGSRHALRNTGDQDLRIAVACARTCRRPGEDAPSGTGQLRGKAAIVTGAGSVASGIGNGRAAAIVYAREGARVLLADINLASALETLALVEKEGGEGVALAADVSRAEDCRQVVETCMLRYGRLDILHNNVGIEIPGGLADTTEEAWDRMLTVNLKSVFLMCRESVPHMEKQRSGAIVNVSSINSIRTLPALSLAYGASKAGVNALTREIAVEYAAKGIRVNAILPGMMATPFVVHSLTQAYGGDPGEMMRRRDAMCPTGRQGDGWDVANLALFLVSDGARYITGATIIVDGGQTCGMLAGCATALSAEPPIRQ